MEMGTIDAAEQLVSQLSLIVIQQALQAIAYRPSVVDDAARSWIVDEQPLCRCS